MQVITRRCLWCGKEGQLEVDSAALRSWQGGALVQEAFPDLDKGLREQLITGTHPSCWEQMMGPEEEEE